MLLIPGVLDLQRQVKELRLQSVAPSTLRLRSYQWNCYSDFCSSHKLSPFPCSYDKIAMYIAFLSKLMKPVSIASYLQALVFKHVVLGLEPPKLNHPHVKSTLEGVKNKFGAGSTHKDPINLSHLALMLPYVSSENHSLYLTWVASLLMFRCLLRVGLVVDSPHTLTRDSVEFTKYGLLLRICSSKTKKSHETPDLIPVNRLPDSKCCAVHHLMRLMRLYPMPVTSPLFSTPKVGTLTYSVFSKNFSYLLGKAGLVGNFASHSLRRGGATCMAELGFSISDIKRRGRWKSSCVNKYICESLDHLVRKDGRWASLLV